MVILILRLRHGSTPLNTYLRIQRGNPIFRLFCPPFGSKYGVSTSTVQTVHAGEYFKQNVAEIRRTTRFRAMPFPSDRSSDTESEPDHYSDTDTSVTYSDPGSVTYIDFVDLTVDSPISIYSTDDSSDDEPLPKRRCTRSESLGSDSSGPEGGWASPPAVILGRYGNYDSTADSSDEDSDDYDLESSDTDPDDTDSAVEWHCKLCNVDGIQEMDPNCEDGDLCTGCYDGEIQHSSSDSDASDSDGDL